MTTEEELKRIKAKCEELLAIAEKRTHGKWAVKYRTRETGAYSISTTYLPFIKSGESVIAEGWESDERNAEDFTFIASCAGSAEAGWRATIAAIDFIEEFRRTIWGWDGDCGLGAYVDAMENSIISAWPEEIL